MRKFSPARLLGNLSAARKLARMRTSLFETMAADVDQEEIHPIAEIRAHWSLFLPTLLVALVYGGAWLYVEATGLAGGALARLLFLVLLLAPPLLLAYAFLRYYSTGVALIRNHLLVSPGWPHVGGEQIPLAEIESVSVRASRLGRLLGAGGLHIRLWDGGEIDVRDLAEPDAFAARASAGLTRR